MTALPPPGLPQQFPSRWGRYELRACRRAEPLGALYQGVALDVGRAVLIKVLAPPDLFSEAARLRLEEAFEAEARRLAADGKSGLFDTGRSSAGHCFVAFDDPEFLGERPVAVEALGSAPLEIVALAASTARALLPLWVDGSLAWSLDPVGWFVAPNGVVRVLNLGLAHLAGGTGLPPEWTRSPGSIPIEGTEQADAVSALAVWLYAVLRGCPADGVRAAARLGQLEPLWTRHPALTGSIDDVIRGAIVGASSSTRQGLDGFADALVSGPSRASNSPASSASPHPASLEPTLPATAPPPEYPVQDYITWAVGLSLLAGGAGWWLGKG